MNAEAKSARTVVNDQAPVWIVVLHWGELADTLHCLESLEQLDYNNRHIVLVNNGSSPSPAPEVRRRFPAVHVIENGLNLGYAEGNNVGLRFALAQDAGFVWLLNNDTEMPANTLTKLVGAVKADERIGMACPAITSFFNHALRYAPIIDWAGGTAGERLMPDEWQTSLDIDYASGCALLVKASVAQNIGLLDPDYFNYYEDVDWSLRCRRAGYRVLIVPEAQVYHKGTPDHTTHRSASLWYYYLRNQAIFLSRYMPWQQRPARLWGYTQSCLMQYQMALKDGDEDAAAAILDGWWSGLTRRTGPVRTKIPAGAERLLRRHLTSALWLTAPWTEWRRRLSPSNLSRLV